MANEVFKVSVTGGQELVMMIEQMKSDFGEKETNKVLVSAVRESLAPALSKAKQLSFDGRKYATGELAASLIIEARRPNRRDKRSAYVKETDAVIAKITTAPKNKLIKIRRALLKRAAKKKGKQFDAQSYDNSVQKFDGRAIAQEFGTAKIVARPYLRPALESTSQEVISRLANAIKNNILNKYRNTKITVGIQNGVMIKTSS